MWGICPASSQSEDSGEGGKYPPAVFDLAFGEFSEATPPTCLPLGAPNHKLG